MPEFQGKVRLTAKPFDLIGADIDVSDGSLALIVSDQEVGEWPLNSVSINSAIDGFQVKVDGEEFIFSTREADAFAAAVGISRYGSRGRKPGKSAKAVTAIKASGLVRDPSSAPTPVRPAKTPKATSPPHAPPKRVTVETPAKRVKVERPARPKGPRASAKPERVGGNFQVEAGRRFATKKVFTARRAMVLAVALALVALALISPTLLAAILLPIGMAGVLLAGAATVDPLLATRLPETWPVSRVVLLAVAMIAAGVMLLAF